MVCGGAGSVHFNIQACIAMQFVRIEGLFNEIVTFVLNCVISRDRFVNDPIFKSICTHSVSK